MEEKVTGWVRTDIETDGSIRLHEVERWVLVQDGVRTHLRIIDWRDREKHKAWVVRWSVDPDRFSIHTEPLPEGLTLEEMQALALTMWRMR
jgi:hypothetical protein